MAEQLARITPVQRRVNAPRDPEPKVLSSREKAAVIVRLMLAEGATLPLSALPEHMQAALTEQLGQMRVIDRTTLGAVVEEFLTELEEVGLSFPGGIEGALTMMDGHISLTAANRLRRLAGASGKADPWERIVNMPPERLLPVLEEESAEVGAVMLSKMPVPKAADLLGRLPGDRARRVAYAMSLTGNVDPETVRRIGLALATQLEALPPRAFETGPVERVGAILNVSSSTIRDEVLKGLEETDAGFADEVKKAIFTYVHIHQRVIGRDVSRIVRMVDQPTLVVAMAGAQEGPARETTEFILANMSQRMAQSLREEIAERGKVKEKDAEAAQAAVVEAIRQLEASGELVLIQPED